MGCREPIGFRVDFVTKEQIKTKVGVPFALS